MQLFNIKLKGKQFVFISQRRRKNKQMLYYDCVHLYLIKMVAIYMQIKRDSASWQFVSGTLSITNHLCPYLSSPGAIWRHFSEEKPNSALKGCKHVQTMCLYRYKPGLPPFPKSLNPLCSFLKMFPCVVLLFITSPFTQRPSSKCVLALKHRFPQLLWDIHSELGGETSSWST